MNVLITINKTYIKQVNILLNSIQYSNKDETFNVYVLHKELEERDKLIIEKGLSTQKFHINMIKIKEEEICKLPQYEKRYPNEIYFRLFATKFLPKDLDRILYLDADTIVINKLNELYNMEFEGNYYIATTHIKKLLHKFHEVRLNIKEEIPYINTGMLLINLNELRKKDIEKEVIQFIKENKTKLMLPDQDVITALYGNKIKLVDSLKYNLGDRELTMYNINQPKKIGLKWICKNTVIIHYYGKNKPWNKDYTGKLGCFYYKMENKLRNTGKVLILSCGTGGGHNSAAKAIQEELTYQGIKADFMEYLDIINPRVRERVNKLYLKTTTKEGKTFKVVYKLGELYQKTNLKSPVYGLNQLNKNKLYNYIKENEYEYIITTHLFAAQALTAIKKEHKIHFIAIATDYECIPFWQETNPDYFIIPSEELKQGFIKKGIKSNKLLALGIPTRRAFREPYDINKCKKQLNLKEDEKYILILSGSMGFGNVEEMVKELLKNITDASIIVACGTNEKLKEKLQNINNIIAISYTDKIDLYMKSSDVILSKPGGLTSTEIAVLGKPFIHTMPIPGCETYNANFFSKNNMSIKCSNINEIVENTKILLHDESKKKELIKNQSKYINKNASEEIANLIKEQIEIRNKIWKEKLS